MKRIDARVLFPSVAVVTLLVGWLCLRWTWVAAFGDEPSLSKETVPTLVDAVGILVGGIAGISSVGSIYVHARWSRLRVALPVIGLSLVALFNALLFLYAVAVFNGVA